MTEDELKPFLALVRARFEEKDSFEQAVRRPVATIRRPIPPLSAICLCCL
jgi:hypothetical protein